VNPGLAKAMHAQSGAEREKRARIIVSEGERTSTQNYSEGNTAINPLSVCNSFPLLPGKRQSDINQSEGARQQAINIAEGLYVSDYSFFIQTYRLHWSTLSFTIATRFQRSIIEAQAQVRI
jgi:regulator of protease activity HflC (stomatin/prohibitin superfamily)